MCRRFASRFVARTVWLARNVPVDSEESTVTHTTRRAFVRIMALSGAATPLLAAAGCASNQPGNDVNAGNISAIPVGTLKGTPGSDPVVIARDASGLYAMSTLCTHAGCDMRTSGQIAADGMLCACHHSTFDKFGNPTGGPAQSTLPHFAVSIAADGTVTIHQAQTVSTSTRTAAS